MTTNDIREVRVGARTVEASGVASFELTAISGAPLPTAAPGSHIDIHLPDNGIRQYSLCGGDNWTIAVLREPAGRGGSEWIHDNLHAGDPISVSGPRNHFDLVDAEDYIFVAGGIGITPILSMIRNLEAEQRNQWRLVYGGRTRESMAFADELAGFGDRVVLAPQDECGLIDIDTALGTPKFGTAVYACGPEPLLQAMERGCRSWPPGSLHVERFVPVQVDSTADRSFDVVAQKSGLTVTVDPGVSILEALEAQGISVTSSCGEGVCGTCETKVLAGEVDHRDAVLTEEERATNSSMMICCSRTTKDRIILDI